MVNFVSYNFLSQATLLRWLTFLLGSPTEALTVQLFWVYSFFLTLAVAFPPWGTSDHVAVSVSIDFPTNSEKDVPFHCTAYDYSHADWDGLRDHLRDVQQQDVLETWCSVAATEFCKWVQVKFDVSYLKLFSSLWFSAASAAVTAHSLHRQNKSFTSKVKFRQTGNYCKGVLEAAKLGYANKTKESITSQEI